MEDLSLKKIAGFVENDPGYFLGLQFLNQELSLARSLVCDQWIEVIKKHAPNQVENFLACGIENYHTLSHLIDHALIWEKYNRTLSRTAAEQIRETSLFEKLENVYGQFELADEENIGREQIYWRIVRPNEKLDVGPLHADAWFWELGHGAMPKNRKRVKVWVALYCEPGLNGLRLVPGSHKKEWRYHGEHRGGFLKPQIDEDENHLKPQLVDTKPGDAIVFHDRLLHGGALNRGNFTRISLEFTLFVKPL